MPSRALLLAATSVAALVSSSAAFSQDNTQVEELVVTGSRTAPRTRLETIAPVDVVSSEKLAASGNTELAQSLSVLLPSLNFTRPAVTDGTDTVRPATLRGLAPDQTLVLLNSKRAHAAALVNLNGSVGYGSGAVDLNTIPGAAIGTVEVLRDGASAQYGSDAIAGVINLRLREARSGGGVTVTTGQYQTEVTSNVNVPFPAGVPVPPSSIHRRDGATTTVSAWQGFGLGDSGFLTLSVEGKNQEHTVRAGPDPRQQYTAAGDPREVSFNRYDNWFGDPQMEQYTGFANAGYDLSQDVHLYGWAGYQNRDAISAANFRRPLQSNAGSNIQSVYPDGFLPKIESEIVDISAGGGAKFLLGGWDADASLVYGSNRQEFTVLDTINTSLGPTSPKNIYAGAIGYSQYVGNFSLTRMLDLGPLIEVNVSAGAEVRYEKYEIEKGAAASYTYGGFATQTTPTVVFGGGFSQGFNGLAPADEVNEHRTEGAVYIDLEKKWDALDIDLAARYENYSDFGDVVTGKAAARYDFTPAFALRGAVSNGFRAPSLQQNFVSYRTTNFVAGVPIDTVLLRASNPVARLIGAIPLDPEKSFNLSGGAVFRAGAFSATIDTYFIRITDRIVLSEILSQANVLALFPASAGIGGARFFTNGVDSETRGVEGVANYKWVPGWGVGQFDLTASASYNATKLTSIRSTPQLSALTPVPNLLPNYRTKTLTDGQPKYKASLSVDWTKGPFGATAKVLYYGKLLQPFNGNNVLGDYVLQPKTLVDLEGRWDITRKIQFALGANNLFDTYPTTPPYVLNGQTISTNGVGAFPNYSPFGYQGRFIYARAGYKW